MCELLGISSSRSNGWEHLLCEFRLRGGGSADNPDGWGIAYRADGELRLQKEPIPAVHSRLFGELCETVRSNLIVAHVRKARLPLVNTYDNTHPFEHVCCGRQWVFAHNGLVPGVIDEESATRNPICQPDGATDSEHAFCRMLGGIAERVTRAAADSPDSWFSAVAGVSELVAAHGKFNFLMSDGVHLIAYGHDRLHHLEHPILATPGTAPITVALVATEPLATDADWQPFEPGELRIYRHGRSIGRILTTPSPVSRTRHASASGILL